jgi:voltage-gated potassium channel
LLPELNRRDGGTQAAAGPAGRPRRDFPSGAGGQDGLMAAAADTTPERDEPSDAPWRRRLYVVIFRNETPGGRLFDAALLLAIATSVTAVLLESVEWWRERYGSALFVVEWAFTVLFTAEYALRVISVRRARHYVLSPLGVIDFLAILPSYLSLLFGGAQTLTVIRALRLLRVFRVLKLPNYVSEGSYLYAALRASRRKITVFVTSVVTIVLIVGSLMYLIEGPEHGFTNIPISAYWAVVTLTTVGYGDIAPKTPLGRFVASAVMILGYGIIAVPTGIVTAELVRADRATRNARQCPACSRGDHDADAKHCKHCGAALA